MELSTGEPEAKRRKVRKGTKSCWECKGRKAKCTYMTAEQAVCDGCFRRGTGCVSQDLPEQPVAQLERHQQMGSRMTRVEALLESLVKQAGESSLLSGTNLAKSVDDLVSTPTEITQSPINASKSRLDLVARATGYPQHARSRGVKKPQEPYLHGHNEQARSLLAIYPSQKSINTIVDMAGPMASFFHQSVHKPYKDIQIGDKEKRHQANELKIRHTPATHPVIIARQMLLLAITFRYIHPDSHRKLQGGFSGPPGLVMQRLGDVAIELFATKDGEINTIDALECLLLASTFQADNGNMRSGWTMARRAMVAAQLMRLHHQKRPPLIVLRPGNDWDPRILWYRIVYFDRFFSLILGLPQGSADSSMGSAFPSGDETPLGRLERGHCVLAGQILQRNERDPSPDNLCDTQAIDAELRKLAESMPSKWWLAPDLASITDTGQLFWETLKLTNQVFHYILLSHLHLPFLLRSTSGPDSHDNEYSRLTCISSSRDLLARYRVLRTFSSVSYCCHSMDFFAITASMTLILAHLDGSGFGKASDSALIHHRTADRAIMEELLDNMAQVGTLDSVKTLSERGAGVLRQLLAIEADAASGSRYRLLPEGDLSSTAVGLRLSIPYFGVITITREGEIHLKTHPTSNNDCTMAQRSTGEDRPRGMAESITRIEAANNGDQGMTSGNDNPMHGLEQPISGASEALATDPGLPPEQDDWTLQGPDISFLEALIGEGEDQTGVEDDFWWLQ